MTETVRVHCINTNEYKNIPVGTLLADLIDVFGVKSKYLIANAKVNNKTESLNRFHLQPCMCSFLLPHLKWTLQLN